MATETEIENLVVRLSADVADLVRGTSQVMGAVQKMTDQVQQQADQTEQSLKKMATTAVGAFTALKAEQFLRSSLSAWEEQQRAIIETESVLMANGRAVRETSEDYQEFSSQMQKLTQIADEVTLSMTAQAESFQLTGVAAKASVTDAIALAKGNSELAQSYMRVTTAMQSGDVERAQMFSRMIPQLRGIKDEAEFMDRYAKSVKAGEEAVRRFNQTVGGQLKQLENDWGDFKEEIGLLVQQALLPAIAGVKDLVHWLQRQSAETKQAIVVVAGLSAGFVVLATVGPRVIMILGGITTAVRALAIAVYANPLFLAAAAAVAGIYLIGRAIGSLSGATSEYNRHLERTKSLAREGIDLAVGPDKDSILAAEQQLRRLQNERAQEEARIQSKFFLNRTVGESFGKTLEPLDESIAEMTRKINAAKSQLETPELRRKKMMEEVNKEADKLSKEFEKQARVAGMTAGEAQIMELKFRGAKEETIEHLQWLNRIAEAADKVGKLKEYEKNLDKELRKARLDEAGRKTFDAAELGADEETLARLRRMVEETERLNKAFELNKKFEDPKTKVAKDIAELDRMLQEGEITWKVYTKAVLDAKGALREAAAAMREVAGYNTAEARSRIYEFLDRPQGVNDPRINQQRVVHHQMSSRQMQLAGMSPYDPNTGPTGAKAMTLWERIAAAVEKMAEKEGVEIQPADIEE